MNSEKNWLLIKNIVGWRHIQYQRQRHFFHMVSVSPWPLYTSISVFSTICCFVGYLHSVRSFSDYSMGELTILNFFMFLFCLYFWFYNIILESRSQHTILVQKSILKAFILFIASEVMFFASFFWAFFHSSIAPSIWIFCTWPPLAMETISAFELPFLNTLILLTSGLTITWAHKALILGYRKYLLYGLFLTIFLACIFLVVQFIEYRYAPFSIYDGIYGSCFFMLTGFHGFHVLLGCIMLIICFFRSYWNHFSTNNHIGFITSAWYWHFVDVVWIFLFVFVYWWGNTYISFNIFFSSWLLLNSLINTF